MDLPSESPDTLFKFARKKDQYDYVITLCNQHTQENYSVLYSVVSSLFSEKTQVIHWNIPDFMSIDSSGEARKTAAQEIVSEIETEVCTFVRQIRKRQVATG